VRSSTLNISAEPGIHDNRKSDSSGKGAILYTVRGRSQRLTCDVVTEMPGDCVCGRRDLGRCRPCMKVGRRWRLASYNEEGADDVTRRAA
jgi:hypothetical protein